MSANIDITADPVSWLISKLSGTIYDSTSSSVLIKASWLLNLSEVPSVTVYRKTSTYQWLSLAGTSTAKKRCYTILGLRVWAKNPLDKFTIAKNLHTTIHSNAKAWKDTTTNLVWIDVKTERGMDEPQRIPPLYSIDVDTELIYDEDITFT